MLQTRHFAVIEELCPTPAGVWKLNYCKFEKSIEGETVIN